MHGRQVASTEKFPSMSQRSYLRLPEVGCPGTRMVTNQLSAISVTIKARGCRGRGKKIKRNYESRT